MKTELKKKKIDGQTVWEWWIKDGRKILAGGMCATKSDAKNDAAIWRDAHAMQPNIRS
jgi:hypothetical protein